MKHTILFVDDDVYVRDGLRRLLHSQAFQWDLYYAENVDEAWEILAECRIDVIVSDVSMPKVDGFQFLQDIRKAPETCDLPVLILTGSYESDLKRHALDMGATDLLNKPIEREDLLARLRSLLRLKAY